ncbi:MAG: SulP family inorganic anion transporter [Acidobacteria bacterium]|nr:SulP family inorganic anion transporter [Acidobacteriota bacterium]
MALKPPEEKTVLQRYLPIVDWLPKYRWAEWIRFDLLAALTVWALLVPEAMAYAGIAGVAPEVGLVTAPLALIGYAIFGSSKHLFVGPSSTVAILSASVVAPLAGSDGDLYLILTVWLAIFTGVFFVALGVARMGWIANFMASSVLSGFMVGLAIVIAVGQLDKLFGIEAEGDNVLQDLGSMLEQFGDWDWPTVAIGAAALASLFLIEEYLPRLPGALVVMLVAIAASAIFDFEGGGIHVVGEIPAELPNLSLPEWPGWDVMSDIMVGALAVIVVAFAESFAAAKSYASRFGYQVDANQEMIGLGVANLGAGLSGGFVVDGSLSKTAAGVGAGQKTQMTSVFAAVFVLLTIVALTWLFEPLPEAVLGAIVIHAVWKLIDFSGFGSLWRARRIDFGLAVAAFLGVILIDILQGIIIGIVLSLVALIYRASFPEGAELGRIEDDEGNYEFVGLDAHPDAETRPGMVVYRQPGSLIFSNAAAFSQQARELLWNRTDPPASVLVVDCEQMADMDVTGAEEIVALFEELQASNVDMWLVRLHGDARITAEKAGVIDVVGEERVFPTLRLAGDRFSARDTREDRADHDSGE